MSLLTQYTPHSSLFASPLGVLITQGCLARQSYVNDRQPLVRAAQDLFKQHAQADIIVGLLPFNTTRAAQLLVPEQHQYLSGEKYVSQQEPHSASNLVRHLHAQPSAHQFETQVEQALAALQNSQTLKKLVMARHLDVELTQTLNRTALLEALWQKNPHGYTYSVPLDETSDPATFLGASPELLLRRQGNQVYLNPLAGTAIRDLTNPQSDQIIAQQLLESKKDQQEHAIVIENIIEALAPFCDSIEAAKTPHLISTATLWHLSTEIRGQLKAPYADALTLALAIHPTPAVCGHPTKEARDHIEAIEQQDRGFFAGAVGWINREGDGEWAVAIRCAHYHNQRLRLSAGAGIVIGSDPVLERIETGNKLRTLLNALHVSPELIQQGITQ